MKCLNCDIQLNNPKAKFCSDKYRMAYKRRTITRTKPEQKLPEQEKITRTEKPEQSAYKSAYTIVENETVYKRPAVIYDHEKDGVVNSLEAK